jgi:hypothetical protein
MEMGVDANNMVQTYQVPALSSAPCSRSSLPSRPSLPRNPLVCVCVRAHTHALSHVLSRSRTHSFSREQKRDAVPRTCSGKRSFSCRCGGGGFIGAHACVLLTRICQAMKALDANGDGKVDRIEFVNWMAARSLERA